MDSEDESADFISNDDVAWFNGQVIGDRLGIRQDLFDAYNEHLLQMTDIIYDGERVQSFREWVSGLLPMHDGFRFNERMRKPPLVVEKANDERDIWWREFSPDGNNVRMNGILPHDGPLRIYDAHIAKLDWPPNQMEFENHGDFIESFMHWIRRFDTSLNGYDLCKQLWSNPPERTHDNHVPDYSDPNVVLLHRTYRVDQSERR